MNGLCGISIYLVVMILNVSVYKVIHLIMYGEFTDPMQVLLYSYGQALPTHDNTVGSECGLRSVIILLLSMSIVNKHYTYDNYVAAHLGPLLASWVH